ncbi:MAG TPA: xanthine dehydrogenase family protein molybdopterin-binding subunit [Acidisarcina sp.]
MSLVGEPITRVDGRLKVTGQAKYAAEFEVPNLAYGFLLLSTIPQGRVLRMETVAAEKAPGIIKILTPFNAPKLPEHGNTGHPPAGRVLQVLQDDQVHYNNQPIAVIVAETLNQAMFAASLIKVRYQQTPPKLDFEGSFPTAHPGGHGHDPADIGKGSIEDALAAAEVKIDQVYTTPVQHHNPLEPHATIAQWDGEKLTVHNATQYISGDRQSLAKAFGLPDDNVRVICPFTGGGFGSKGSTWSHVLLAAMAARVAGRPVKIVLDRPQMFGPVGARPQTHQHIVIGAKRDGSILAIRHDAFTHTSMFEDFTEPSSVQTRMLYGVPNISTSQRLVPLTTGTPTFMRAPGESTGTFGLESALDEMAYALNMDPIALRLKNYAEKDPTSDKPFSSKNLKECYARGAEKFGWAKRNPEPRSTKDGRLLVGWGMATATYSANRSTAACSVSFEPNGRVTVASGTQDLGTGMYTLMAQVAADALKMPIEKIDAKLGDSLFPRAPVSGGSQSAASVTPAVQAACKQAILKLTAAAASDAQSPFHGVMSADLDFANGKVFRKSAPKTGEDFTDLISRSGGKPIEATASAERDQDSEQYSTHSWGAVFAEVAVDEAIGMPRVRRVVGVYDIGTLLNSKTGTNQLIGGVVWGISLALHEHSARDSRYGRIANNNLAEYHVPVNLDIGEIDVSALNIPDLKFNPLGARGIGEIGITGTGAAVANAIYHATGKRFRNAPITPDLLMA